MSPHSGIFSQYQVWKNKDSLKLKHASIFVGGPWDTELNLNCEVFLPLTLIFVCNIQGVSETKKKSNMNWKDAQLWWHKVPTGFAFVGGVAWFPLVGSLSGDIWYLDLSIPRWTRNIAQQCASFPLVDSLSGQVVRTQTLPLAPASTWTGGSLPPPSSQPPPPSPTGHQPHLFSPSTPEPQMQETKYFMRSLHPLKILFTEKIWALFSQTRWLFFASENSSLRVVSHLIFGKLYRVSNPTSAIKWAYMSGTGEVLYSGRQHGDGDRWGFKGQIRQDLNYWGGFLVKHLMPTCLTFLLNYNSLNH